MADTFIGADVGDSIPVELTVASSTTSKAVELRVLVDASTTRLETIQAVQGILAKLSESPVWPPANT